jgi:hypothetical protein
MSRSGERLVRLFILNSKMFFAELLGANYKMPLCVVPVSSAGGVAVVDAVACDRTVAPSDIGLDRNPHSCACFLVCLHHSISPIFLCSTV